MLYYRIFCLACISIIISACSNAAYNMRMGIISFKVGDYRSAFIRLKPQAYRGQAEAQYAVGYMYYYGQGVVENRAKARFWIKKAASQGQPEARVAMGILCK